MKLINKIFNYIFDRCNKQQQTPILDSIINKVNDLGETLLQIKEELEFEKCVLKEQMEYKEALLTSIIEVMPDMVWLKLLDGTYEIANKTIRNELLFDDNPIGKNDIELSQNAKLRFGERNHTFGEVCGDSDRIVVELAKEGKFTKDSGRFLEYGKIKGKMMYLEVNKAPVYVKGELIGVCGSSRDITYYYENSNNHKCGKCPLIDNVFDKFKYVNGDEDGRTI